MPRSAFRSLTSQHWEIDLRDLRRQQGIVSRGGIKAFCVGNQVLIECGGRQVASISLTAIRPHFGGRRFYLRCPECRGLVRIIYSPQFVCRRCAGLLHPSTRQRGGDRAIERAVRLRRRLGGDGCLLERFPARPKGMHTKTWLRLFNECRHDEIRGIAYATDQLGFRDYPPTEWMIASTL